ncbi:MAG: PEP/pyruvate-binding domain-containing protein [Thermodesulfobacteriota bacterium]
MTNLLAKLKGLFRRRRQAPLTEAQEEKLFTDFQARYHDFRLLLAANNRALETMASLEAAAAGDRVFGMSFVRARCTALAASVYNMAKHLDSLAPAPYPALFQRFKDIQAQIDLALQKGRPPVDGQMVVELGQVDKLWADRVGGKMANLGEVVNRLGLPAPPGFVITAAACGRFFEHNQLQAEIDRRIQSATLERIDQLFALSSYLQQLIVGAEVPADLAQEVQAAYRRLEQRTRPGVTVSLRSSALGEDEAETSFAGQYRSQLNVRPEHILESFKEVVASKYTPQAMHYRYERGLRDSDIIMCVGCLAMVQAASGGVVYTQNPVDQMDREVRITSAWGLPKGVVDGDAPADLFVVSRGEPPQVVQRQIAHKGARFDCFPAEGVCRLEATGDQADQPSLSDSQALALAGLALKLEEHYGAPQDVEWALDHQGRLLILQTRYLRRVAPPKEAAAAQTPAGALAGGGAGVSPGVACGPVFWVKKDSDALRFPEGAVLAVDEPWPRWAALLGRAAALVAQKGTVAGHLATVAREYGLPAIFGLGAAAEALVDGQVVTVDADRAAVFPGRDEQILLRSRPKRALMKGSPVHQTLLGVLRFITPLNLLDPDSPEFAAASCQTLHDITRFCHEKSVQEMFAFGKEHHFPQRSSKQLFYEVPMQYWIINLDDGFKEEVSGRYVRLEDIACQPLLALWRGMVAVPWEGPPAMSGKGFASVLFQATANPALATPFKTAMANRNYFMISKSFLNLQSRFGFHFASVEAMAGERPAENYLSFSFVGGAADAERKSARARFIGDIIGELGFVVELRGDTLRARVEGRPAQDILRLLEVVGYLLMHTRQLDMIMADPASVQHYRQKIKSDLAALEAA